MLEPSAPHERSNVFVSYSHKDKRWLDQLLPHLGSLARRRGVVTWDDTKLQTGAHWYDEIERAISRARVAILLISPNFLDSSFIDEVEVPRLLSRAKNNGLTILPVIVSPCNIENHPELSKFQPANAINRSIRKLKTEQRDMLFVQLSNRIESLLTQAINQQKLSLPKQIPTTATTNISRAWFKIVEARYGQAVLIECRSCGITEIVEARSGGKPSSVCRNCGAVGEVSSTTHDAITKLTPSNRTKERIAATISVAEKIPLTTEHLRYLLLYRGQATDTWLAATSDAIFILKASKNSTEESVAIDRKYDRKSAEQLTFSMHMSNHSVKFFGHHTYFYYNQELFPRTSDLSSEVANLFKRD